MDATCASTSRHSTTDVRKAFRLLVDREQIIKIALDGYGEPGNDVFSRWDGAPQFFHRSRDVERAKALLKKAGQENLAVDLVTADIANGVVASAQVLARQALDAGVTVNVRQVTPDVFFGDQYLKWPFPRTLAQAICRNSAPSADVTYNETHWQSALHRLYQEALATVDRASGAKWCDNPDDHFEEGGYIIHPTTIIDLGRRTLTASPPARFYDGDYGFGKIWLS